MDPTDGARILRASELGGSNDGPGRSLPPSSTLPRAACLWAAPRCTLPCEFTHVGGRSAPENPPSGGNKDLRYRGHHGDTGSPRSARRDRMEAPRFELVSERGDRDGPWSWDADGSALRSRRAAPRSRGGWPFRCCVHAYRRSRFADRARLAGGPLERGVPPCAWRRSRLADRTRSGRGQVADRRSRVTERTGGRRS